MIAATRRRPGRPRNRARLLVPLLALLALTTAAQAADWRVPTAQAPSLAAALERARDGDRIVLAPGTYRERVVVRRSVTITAAPGAARPVLDGSGEGRVLEVQAPGVTLQGLAVRNSGDTLETTDACIYVAKAAKGTRVLGNHLEDCAFGIWVNGTKGVDVGHNTIRGRAHPVFSDRGNGINLWEMHDGRVHDNDIAQVRDGVYLSVTIGSEVTDNRMRDLRFGIHYMFSDSNRVTGNVTCDSQVGFALMFSKRLDIRDNVALRNRDHGILFRSILDSQIVGNRVEGNNKGFFLNDASFNEIHGNRVADNEIGVHITGGSENNTVTGNAFIHNAVQVRFAWNYPIHWDDGAHGNHWSDYLGWDLDGDAVGDRPYYASGNMDRLLFRYPQLKVLASSPIVALMQSLEARFPVLRPPSIVDRHPALRPDALQGAAAQATTPDAACGTQTLATTHSQQESS